MRVRLSSGVCDNPCMFRSLKPRVFAVASVIIASILFAIVAIPQYFSKQARLDVLRANVGQVASMAASVVDGDLHGQLLDRNSFTPELYAQALKPLVKLHNASPHIFYVYTMAELEGKTYFVLDTANSPDLKTPQQLQASEYLEPFTLRKEYESDWLQRLAAGDTWVTPTFETDDYGNFLTGHAPVFDSNGKYVGFVGVDFNLEYYLAQEARFRTIVAWSLLIACLVALVLGYLVARYQFALHDQVQKHYFSSMRDELTALLNRRGALAAVGKVLSDRAATTHAALIVDIDHFKLINDTHGHAVGDRVIARLAESINHCIRGGDISARLGGDEFMIFAPDCDMHGAQEIADRLLSAVRQKQTEQDIDYTVSIGITVEAHRNADFDTMYRRADTALYQAKSDGKNRYAICVEALSKHRHDRSSPPNG
jgi:diguanylate cyclase (GGDEF)-like protein